jgi:ribosomal-protein-alanine N-acetyltransferase
MAEFASGKICYLRALRREDLEGPWAEWLNDPEVTKYMLQGAFPTTAESNAAFYDSIATSRSDVVLAIALREDDRHVGNVGLHRIDPIHRTAESGMLIGDRSVWGRGIASEASWLVFKHGFIRLNLARVWIGVMADHAAMIKVYQRLGFQIEGRLRQDIARDGGRVDKLIMGLLAGELKDL